MFSSPRVNFIQSDIGFSIELIGRTGMEYREGKKAMYIESEILMTSSPTIAIWKDEIRAWRPPCDNETITEEQKIEILKRICAALKWQNTQVQIHSKNRGWVNG